MARASNRIKKGHAIWYDPDNEQYYVWGYGGVDYSFPTLEDAERFYEEVREIRLNSKMAREKARAKARDDEALSKAIPWPFNLMRAMGKDRLPPVEKVLEIHESLPDDRHKKVMEAYYKEGGTMAEIGKSTGLTYQRVSQIVKYGVLRLAGACDEYLFKKDREEAQRPVLEDLKAHRDALVEEFRRTGVLTDEMTVEFGEPKFHSLSDPRKFDDMPVEDLDLSVRSTNCLRRNGIDTVGKLLSKTKDELLWHVRNLGKRSLREIVGKLADMGLELK